MNRHFSKKLYRRRLFRNRFHLSMAWLTMAFGLFFLIWILYTLFAQGLESLSLNIFRLDTPPQGMEGGLRNAIWGSLLITFFALLIGTPIGILCGIFLAEFGKHSRLASATRFMNDILLSAPSIIIGLFIYALYVARVKHFSGWAGSLALSLLVIPVVVRTTENMLRLVPDGLREAAYALGAPKWKMVSMVTLRSAQSGVITGILLALARILGETAPLLYTALNNQFFSSNMNQPMSNLPNVIFQYAMSPYQDWQSLAWAAALMVTFMVLISNILARLLSQNK